MNPMFEVKEPTVRWSTNPAPRAAGRDPGPARPWHFLASFLQDPFGIGSLWPSSPALARCVVDCCALQPGDRVVELGPGTGAFTGPLLDRLYGTGRLVAVELHEPHARALRERFPECRVVHGSAEHLPAHLEGSRVQCVVSGLAWGNMRASLQNRILDAVDRSLAAGGVFVAFTYLHARVLPTMRHFRRQLRRRYRHVEMMPVVWRNLPPAYVLRCGKA